MDALAAGLENVAAPQAVDRQAAATLARETAALVDEDLGRAVDRLAELLALPLSGAYLEQARQAATQLDNFDTDEAKAGLEALATALEQES